MAMECRDWGRPSHAPPGPHAGLRVSELLALTWDDLELRNGRLAVRFSVLLQVLTVCLH